MRQLKDIREKAECIGFYLDDRRYRWGGMLGAVLKSDERGVKKGEIRAIVGIPFYAYNVLQEVWPFGKLSVSWVPIEDVDMDWIREFKRMILL